MFFKKRRVIDSETTTQLDKTRIPNHIAVIMDGNGRWAKRQNLPRVAGHQRGMEVVKDITKAASDLGVKVLTLYAFSTENWNRKKEEVDFLMDLFGQTLKKETKEMHEKNVVIEFIGDLTKLSANLQKILNDSRELTKNNTGVHLQIAFNYGSRLEIVQAVQNIIKKGVKAEDVNEELISSELYTAGAPDPDLLIRTGGEMRISNYLLWQIAYSEFYVTQKFWPEFDKKALEEAVLEFNRRQRRFGV